MPENKFNSEWEALPEVYKTRFAEILEERGLANEFDSLSDEHKSQILGIIKDTIRDITKTDNPTSDSPDS